MRLSKAHTPPDQLYECWWVRNRREGSLLRLKLSSKPEEEDVNFTWTMYLKRGPLNEATRVL